MKPIALIITVIFVINQGIDAQYHFDKTQYKASGYRYYEGDLYNPALMGTSSFVLPGLGQLLEGENLRGIGFLSLLVGVNIIQYQIKRNPESGYYQNNKKIWTIRYIKLGIHVWSALDAGRVAKIKNLAFRDKNKRIPDVQVLPFVSSDDNFQCNNVSAGMTILVSF
jgi:hypothetical protein